MKKTDLWQFDKGGRKSYLLFFVFLIAHCSLPQELVANRTVIAGQVLGTENPAKLIYMTEHQDGQISVTDSIFHTELSIDRTTMIHLVYQSQRWDIYVEPGDSIHLVFDHYDLLNFAKSLQYTGDHALENQALFELRNLLNFGLGGELDFYLVAQPAFRERMIELENSANEYLRSKVLNLPRFSPTFQDWAQAYASFSIDYHLEKYALGQQEIHFDPASIRTLRNGPEPSIAKDSSGLKENVELLDVTPYRMYLRYALRNNHRANLLKHHLPDQNEQLLWTIESALRDPALKEYAKFNYFRGHLANGGLARIEDEVYEFLEHSKNPQYKARLQQQLENWKGLFTGAEAPPFALPDLGGLQKNLGDFHGRYLYVDVWATWCKPCRDEFPALAKLRAHYRDHPDLVFLGISIDKNKEAWKELVLKLELEGIQLFAGPQSSFQQDYRIKGIPHYLLIDKQGKLLDYSAPLPSSEEIRMVLDDLIEN